MVTCYQCMIDTAMERQTLGRSTQWRSTGCRSTFAASSGMHTPWWGGRPNGLELRLGMPTIPAAGQGETLVHRDRLQFRLPRLPKPDVASDLPTFQRYEPQPWGVTTWSKLAPHGSAWCADNGHIRKGISRPRDAPAQRSANGSGGRSMPFCNQRRWSRGPRAAECTGG